jgi:hypothetical protein
MGILAVTTFVTIAGALSYKQDPLQIPPRRAGLPRSSDSHGAGLLRGYVDPVGPHVIEGWGPKQRPA